MIPGFQSLDESETELALKAPILVCILIAGADGTIDRKEIKEAITVTQHQEDFDAILSSYIAEMAEDFEDKMKILIQSYPYESTQRTPLIVAELAGLNNIWKKLDKTFATAFYAMLINLAKKIASSSGGLLGLRSVDAEEAKYISLPMVKDPSKI